MCLNLVSNDKVLKFRWKSMMKIGYKPKVSIKEKKWNEKKRP